MTGKFSKTTMCIAFSTFEESCISSRAFTIAGTRKCDSGWDSCNK